MRAIGLISGTSCDGIDAALVDIVRSQDGLLVRLEAFETVDYSPPLRSAIFAAFGPPGTSAREICALNFAIGEEFADAAFAVAGGAGIAMDSIGLIGSHGQTLYHDPHSPDALAAGSTLQVGEAAVIAQRTGVPCVANFRAADVAAGGEGAPLVPYLDFALLRSESESRAAVNIGGIANITLLPAACGASEVRAFDTGPGNMVIDECVKIATSGDRQYDEAGAFAARGAVDPDLLLWLLSHPYFARVPPKSTGREEFGRSYAASVWRHAVEQGRSAEEIVATVTALTARTIAEAVPDDYAQVIVSGGGTHNTTLLGMLADELGTHRLQPSDAFGIDVDAKEAIAFAVLAYDAVAGRPNNLPSCTGALRQVVMGSLALNGAAAGRMQELISAVTRGR